MSELHKACVASLVCLAVSVESPLRGAEPATLPVLVNVLDQAEVSPREPGVLMTIDAREGRQVTQGETLAQIDDTAERYLQAKAKLEMEIAAKEAASELGLLDAQKTMAVAQALYKRASESEQKFPNSIAQTDLERLRLDAEKSELAVRQARHDQEIARLEYDLKKAEFEFATQRVQRRKIIAPFDGMIVERKGRRGEWVQPGDKVIRMIRLDRLRVEGFLPARTARRELEGSPVRLSVEVPGRSNLQYQGQLVFVSPEVDPVNDQVRVLADIENPGLTLRPGLRGTMVMESSALAESGLMPENDRSSAAVDQPLPMRMRPDLVVRSQRYGGHRHWVVKDPVSLRYFHLLDEEFSVLQMLDGRTSRAEVQQQYEQQFAPQRLRPTQLQSLFYELHRKGLVLVDADRQDRQLLERRRQQRRLRWLEAGSSPLAVRFPGVDPEPLLQWLEPRCRWLYTRTAGTAWLILALSAAGLIAVHFDTLLHRLPELQSFFTAGNLPVLVVALALVKIFHELAHAVTCKHYGGECHQIGVMLLVFTPCLYCDVSDAWLLPGKRQRIAISAAGIYLEVFLASACTFLWWYTHPGLLNSLALNVALLCSVGTIVFNGNPLMRFDGYYIFADFVEIPNLQARSREALSRRLAAWSLGTDLPGDRLFVEERGGLLTSYAVASLVYRCVIIVGIFFFLGEVLRPYRLQVLAQTFILVASAGMIVAPAWRLSKFLRDPLMRRQVRRGHVIRSAIILLGLAIAILAVPLPCGIDASVSLEVKDAHPVYVTVSGSVDETVAKGCRVAAGDVLARLERPETRIQVIELTSQRNRQAQQVRHLEARRGVDPNAASQIPSARQMLADLEERRRQLERHEDLLTLKAPVDGEVILPTLVLASQQPVERLATWSGTPLDRANRGCYLEAGTLFCLVGDPRRLEAVAIVDQAEMELIQAGQRVKIRLDQWPWRTLRGTVVETARIKVDVASRTLVATGGIPVRTDSEGVSRPFSTVYQVRVDLEQSDFHALAGAPGRCKIAVAPQSLARRLLRYVNRNFRSLP